MKKLYHLLLIFLVVLFLLITIVYSFYSNKLKPVNNSNKIVEVEIPKNTSVRKIAKILKDNDLIKDENTFIIYVKLAKANNIKAGYYDIKSNSGVKKIVSILQNGSTKNPNEISITFKEGINMRNIATVISDNTNNSYDSVISKSNDIEYINTLINKYWFITEDIKNDNIYYKLEGYLFPDTYRFEDKNVSVEDIFNKMLNKMQSVLEPFRKDIEKNNLSIHEILTLASMVEKEAAREIDRTSIASVFLNRINKNMSLGSDVTTRYAFKVDNPKQVLTKIQYATPNPYNTRVTDGSMNGKLPIGPICTLSVSSIKASIYPEKTDYIYFIANIKTLETFFYNNSNDFEKKKNELASVNAGF